MPKLDEELHKVKKEVESLFLDTDPLVFDFKKNSFRPSGKAIRARFAILFSAAAGLDPNRARDIAVCSELTHTASLLHDDCVDGAGLRRGQSTINARFGINTAILLGDLTIALAFKKAEKISCEISSDLVAAVKKMTEGALMEETMKGQIISEADYAKMVSLKTSSLFRWTALSAAYSAGLNLFKETAEISEAFGLSFQIIDDIMDMNGEFDSGKDALKDLAEGKTTMPTILAMEDAEIAGKIKLFFSENRDMGLASEIAESIAEKGYLEKAGEKAKNLILPLEKNLLKFPDRKAALAFYDYILVLTERKN